VKWIEFLALCVELPVKLFRNPVRCLASWYVGAPIYPKDYTQYSKHGESLKSKIYFCVIFLEMRHHAQAHVTSGALIHCPCFARQKNTHGSAVGLMISLTSVCYGDFC